MNAADILNQASQIMDERGKSYDSTGQGSERSMEKIVAMFNALTGHTLTTEQGWKFMCCLKLARSEQGEHKGDNYLDLAAYAALAGETASEDATDKKEPTLAEALRDMVKQSERAIPTSFYTPARNRAIQKLREDIGDSVTVLIDSGKPRLDGSRHMYVTHPPAKK